MSEVTIRPYEQRDRAAVREICCDTADRGEPVENFFPDRKVIADLITRYYTDFEPQTSWVAELDGNVVGYLNGCLDSRLQRRKTLWPIAPLAIGGAIARGTMFRAQAWRFFFAMCKTIGRRGLRLGVSLADYPAHVHVNVRKDGRGRQVGGKLMERFMERARQARVPGVHASVRGDNDGGRQFFERLRFEAVSSSPMVLPDKQGWKLTETVIYGKKL